MAILSDPEILRANAGGEQTGADIEAGENVEILEAQGEWTRIRVDNRRQDEGWVPTNSIDAGVTSPGRAGPFDPDAFADLCVLISLTYEINPHFLIGISKFRSNLKDANNGNEIGPFQLTATQWDSLKNEGFRSDAINAWDMQVAGFALMVQRDQTLLGAHASPVDLYRAEWPNSPADISDKLKDAFDATAQLEGSAETRIIGQAAASKITDPKGPLPATNKGSTVQKLVSANTQRWQNMVIAPTHREEIDRVARQLTVAERKSRYQGVSATTGVPWFIIAVIHEREKSGDVNFLANIAQGSPWNQKSKIKPPNGPFGSFEEAAVEALTNCPPFAKRWTDWSIGGALTLLEQYNGLGYAYRNLPSPYIWSFTNQYTKGKFIRDGVFDSEKVDPQLGSGPLLQRMQLLDSSIVLTP